MRKLIVGSLLCAVVAGAAVAQTVVDDSVLPGLRAVISSMHPQMKVARVDRDRLTARRVDIVDKNGMIRMTLAGDAPGAVIDGIEYKRSIPFGGLLIFDDKGNEFGGIGYNPARQTAQLTFDYATNDAVAVMARDDGTSEILMNTRSREYTHPAFGKARLPLGQGKTRLRLRLNPNGQPEVALSDASEKTRLRLTVTDQGYGAIEFLDAQGHVVSTIAPERDLAAKRRPS